MAKPIRDHKLFKLVGSFPKREKVYLSGARVVESLNTITEMRIEFVTEDTAFDMAAVVGKTMGIEMIAQTEDPRYFTGTCVAIEYLGEARGAHSYAAEVRPWLWFLTKSKDSRVFQWMTVLDIINKVLSDLNFSDVEMNISNTHPQREYCVQYDETNFDFLSRLMEEEGLFYFFTYSDTGDVLCIGDSVSAYRTSPTGVTQYKPRGHDGHLDLDHIHEWGGASRVAPGKVTLVNYDLNAPNADLKVSTAIAKGTHAHAKYEIYSQEGRYTELQNGEDLSKLRMEGLAHEANRYVGVGNVRGMGTGMTLKLKGAPQLAGTADLVAISAVHYLKADTDPNADKDRAGISVVERIAFPEGMANYQCNFVAAMGSEPYRPPVVTPRPYFPGLMTAVVTGQSEEEINVDSLGRVLVQFVWDREGKKDEHSSCRVRVVLPWTGNGWGMYAVPRIGQEVLIQFEGGDMDRPICTGMVYNGQNAHPLGAEILPTQTGIKTNSTKGGGGFHELTFEDKKDAEWIRFKSQKDYHQIVNNNALIQIGATVEDGGDGGDLKMEVHRDRHEIVETGDYTLEILEGSRITTIKTDDTLTVEGNSTTTINGNADCTIDGNNGITVKGDRSTAVKGKENLEVTGNIRVKSKAKIEIDADSEIKLKVGSSSITITKSSISLESTSITVAGKKVEVKADAMAKLEGKITEVKAAGILTVKGSLTKIN